jgi:hypothetical protein
LTYPEFHDTHLINQAQPIMNPNRLSPLPSNRATEDSGSLKMEREGFVDEEVVLALVNGPRHLRSTAYPADLALAADDLDFAGWQLPREAPVRGPEIPPQVISAIVRRAMPPALEESGIGAPHSGSHRWWMAGLAGVLSTMLFSLLLLTLSSRTQFSPEPAPNPVVVAPAAPTLPQTAEPQPEATSALADGSTQRP